MPRRIACIVATETARLREWLSPCGAARKNLKQAAARIIMTTATMTMMTAEDIRTEFGWSDDMIRSLLQNPDSTKARRCKSTGEYAYEHYYRDRVLAVAQSKEGLDAKRRDETLCADRPNPGWTTRLGDMGRVLEAGPSG
jgi:hypothetical protein